MENIFLIGYMGSGKTTMGKLLAKSLGYSFVDIDHMIEEKQQKTVAQIFADLGQEKFRELERQCLHEVGEFEDCVIATGGGAPCFFDNMQYMNEKGTTIYIDLSIEQLADRLETSKPGRRPILADRKGDELRRFIAEGLASRLAFYQQAKYSVSGSDHEILAAIMVVVTDLAKKSK